MFFLKPEQGKHLSELQESLTHHNITLSITYSTTLHDREIQFSNGWIVRIGRGLDYFQRPKVILIWSCYEFLIIKDFIIGTILYWF